MNTTSEPSKSVIRALERYENPDADRFYARVWAGEDIYIGIGLYETVGETIYDACCRTVVKLAAMLPQPGPGTRGLELGSGRTPFWRQGVSYCGTAKWYIIVVRYHRAYDRGMFAFAPDSMAISYRTSGPKGEELAISNSTLEHLSLKPHPEALAWAWRRWNTE